MSRDKKKKFCKHCGFEIDGQTKKCTGCGKQYFKLFKKHSGIHYVMCFLIVALMAGNTASIGLYINEQHHADELSYKCRKKENEISDLKKELEKQTTAASYWKEQSEQVLEDTEFNPEQTFENAEFNAQQPQNNTGLTGLEPKQNNEVVYVVENTPKPTCDYPSCDSSPNDGGYYCTRHECNKSGCHNARANDYCSYCYMHKCVVPDCNFGQAYNSNYCYMHR